MGGGSTPEAGPEVAGRRLLWRCRRGTRELDVLLERYATRAYAAAGATERAAFVQLLDLTDPQLADYLLGGVTPSEPALQALVRAIRATPPPASARTDPGADLCADPCSGGPGAAQASSPNGPC